MTCSQVNESPTFLRIQIFIPEPPPGHPLFDAEAQKKFEQFKELASSLHHWIREHTTIMQVGKQTRICFKIKSRSNSLMSIKLNFNK